MQFRVDSLGLSGGVTQVLRDLIHQRLGLFYEANQFDQLADRLAPLVVARGFGSFMDYYYFLKYSDERDEWTKVMDALAVHETYFWREIDQLRALVEVVVPQLVRRGASSLKIWSVPCSTGEEPLTLAMLLSEAGWFNRLPIEVMASDASPEAIADARAGRVRRSDRSETSRRPCAKNTSSPHDNKWTVDPELQRRVSYDVVNLVDEDEVRRHASAPIVVCRNVFIYFSEASIRRALGVFERAMPVPGYLCVGAVRITAPSDGCVRTAGHRRGVHVREGCAAERPSSRPAAVWCRKGFMTRPVRVLVVDDSAYIRKVVKEMLTRQPSIEVVGTARDGEDALELVERLRPDVVTCDLIMPGVGGVEFIRRQMASRPVPIVIVSIAAESSERVLSGLDAGAFDFVQKPTALATEKVFDLAEELASKIVAAAEAPLGRLRDVVPAEPLPQATSSGRYRCGRAWRVDRWPAGPQIRRFLDCRPNFPFRS